MNRIKLTAGKDYEVTETWPMVLSRPVRFEIGDLGANYDFLSGNQLLGFADRKGLVICDGYALDGYSPVIKLFGAWREITPVPRHAGHGFDVLHDFTRQFLKVEGCPWNRTQTDDWFFDGLVLGGESERIAGVYHHVVAGPVGSAYILFTRKTDPALRIVRTPYAA
jgi:hypothetical protein